MSTGPKRLKIVSARLMNAFWTLSPVLDDTRNTGHYYSTDNLRSLDVNSFVLRSDFDPTIRKSTGLSLDSFTDVTQSNTEAYDSGFVVS